MFGNLNDMFSRILQNHCGGATSLDPNVFRPSGRPVPSTPYTKLELRLLHVTPEAWYG